MADLPVVDSSKIPSLYTSLEKVLWIVRQKDPSEFIDTNGTVSEYLL
jgi:hypothetical protein